jgi:hypothetical protein
MYKSATKCNETLSKWCKNKHGASKIIDTFWMYQSPSIVGVAVATTRVDRGATAVTMTRMRVIAATVHHAQIPIRYRCLRRQTITEK